MSRLFGTRDQPSTMLWPGTMLLTDVPQTRRGKPFRQTRRGKRVSRTVTVVEKAQTLIVEDAGQQLTKLAPVLGVDERTMRWIGAEDLRFKSYVDCSKTVDGNCNLS